MRISALDIPEESDSSDEDDDDDIEGYEENYSGFGPIRVAPGIQHLSEVIRKPGGPFQVCHRTEYQLDSPNLAQISDDSSSDRSTDVRSRPEETDTKWNQQVDETSSDSESEGMSEISNRYRDDWAPGHSPEMPCCGRSANYDWDDNSDDWSSLTESLPSDYSYPPGHRPDPEYCGCRYHRHERKRERDLRVKKMKAKKRRRKRGRQSEKSDETDDFSMQVRDQFGVSYKSIAVNHRKVVDIERRSKGKESTWLGDRKQNLSIEEEEKPLTPDSLYWLRQSKDVKQYLTDGNGSPLHDTNGNALKTNVGYMHKTEPSHEDGPTIRNVFGTDNDSFRVFLYREVQKVPIDREGDCLRYVYTKHFHKYPTSKFSQWRQQMRTAVMSLYRQEPYLVVGNARRYIIGRSALKRQGQDEHERALVRARERHIEAERKEEEAFKRSKGKKTPTRSRAQKRQKRRKEGTPEAESDGDDEAENAESEQHKAQQGPQRRFILVDEEESEDEEIPRRAWTLSVDVPMRRA